MTRQRVLINFFYAQPVGHAVEALHYCLGHHTLRLLRKGGLAEATCETGPVSAVQRVREILQAIGSARFPSRPKRRYDLIGEALARPFGGSAGRGAVRAGGVTDDDKEAGSGER